MFKLKLSKTYYSKNDNVLQYKIIIFFINLEMADQLFKNDKNHILKKPIKYNMKSNYAENFYGLPDYQYDKKYVLDCVLEYLKN